jgi:diguanylate cyclase (GGDEF)-like protein
LVEWSAERIGARLAAAQVELDQIGQQIANPAAIQEGTLRQALDSSQTFTGLFVLNLQGNLLGVAGAGTPVQSLLDMIQPRSALDSDLVTVMQAKELRAKFGGLQSATLQAVDLPGQPPTPFAGIPLRDERGKIGAVLVGLIRREEIAATLRSDLLGSGSSVRLTDAEDRVIAERHIEGVASALVLPDRVADSWSLHYAFRLEELGWTVRAEVHMIEGIRPLLVPLALLVVMTPALALIFGSLGFMSATRMAKPLSTLYEGMRNAARDADPEEISALGIRGEEESLILAFNATIRRLRDKNAEAERSNRALRDQNQAFQNKHESLSKLSVTDALTQLSNRRSLEDQLNREVKRLARGSKGLAMLVADVDDFKKLNDTLGHAAGDEILKQIARILQETARATDIVARFGGEEFVIVTTSTTLEGATMLGEKLRTAVAEASFIVDDSLRPQKATISIGVAEFCGSQIDLFNRADAALYRAKASGKNCVCAAEPGESELAS